jgi:hypothetical protein
MKFHIRSLLKNFYEKCNKDQREFTGHREKELAAFTKNRAKEA